ncbi:MAG TPA: disulfide oxidoreductase, partial [Thalassospira sp.]|nr:disulfide oxidoreductase [Thalassospira sp.]
GCVPRSELESLVKDLSDEDRKALAKLGVRLGVETVHVLDALKPDPVELRGILWAVARELEALPELPPAGRTSVPNDRANSKGFYLAAGYMPVGPLAARVDMLERFAALLRQKARENDGKVRPDPDLLSLLGCTVEQAEGVFTALGWRAEVTKVKKSELEAKEADKKAEESAKETKPEAEKAEAETSDAAATEAKADAPAEEPAAPAEAKAEPAEAAADASAEATSETPAVETDADGDELVEVKYFVRVDRRKRGGGQNRGQRGPRQEARGGGKGGPKGKGGNRPNQGGKGGRGGKPGGGRNHAPEKANQINEDSPFAKLKEMLEAKG